MLCSIYSNKTVSLYMVLQLNMFQDFTNIMSPQFLTAVSTLELYVAWEVCNSDKI